MTHKAGLGAVWLRRLTRVALEAARLPARAQAPALLRARVADVVARAPGFLEMARRNLAATLAPAPDRLDPLLERTLLGFLLQMQDAVRWNLLGQRPRLEADDALVDLLRGGGLVICHHYGPFLQSPRVLADLGLDVRMIMHRTVIPRADRLVMGPDSDRWLRRIPTDLGGLRMARQVQRALGSGELLLCSVDQSPGDQLGWMLVPFLGRRLRVATGVFELARDAGVPVLGLFCERTDDETLRVRLVPPDPPHERTLAELVGRQLRLLELEIERDPAGWSWWLRPLWDGLSET